jgi:hypothetical protein
MDTNENKAIVALVAVGRSYVEEIVPYYNRLKKSGYEVKVLTDHLDQFESEDVTPYTKRIFNYFDKIYFTLELVKRYNRTVIFVDGEESIAEWMIERYTNNLTTDCTYVEDWQLGGFLRYANEATFEYLTKYLALYDIPIKDYPTIYEHIVVFNKTIDYQLVIDQLEQIQPVFDYMAVLNCKLYNKPFILGHAEGLALSIILDQNNITLQKVTIKKLGLE